jgi:hypothetical protein
LNKQTAEIAKIVKQIILLRKPSKKELVAATCIQVNEVSVSQLVKYKAKKLISPKAD